MSIQVSQTIKVTHVVESTSIYGGHVISAIGIANSLSELDGVIITLYLDMRDTTSSFAELPKRTFFFNSLSTISFLFKLIFFFRNDKPDIIHIHGAWSLITLFSSIYAYFLKIPYVINTHGMLSPKAFQYKRFKKNLALFLYQNWCLKNSKLLIATSVFELNDLYKFGFGSKCIVVSQGFKFLNLINLKNLRLDSSRVKKVLFLSRLHSIKGIYELLEVWKIINPSGWVLNIAGPDECGNLKKINNFIYLHNLQNSINILGPADNALKSELFSEADLFVLPSYSENFGLVILEALAYGLPVITTKNTPWNSLEEYSCGWWIDMNINTLHVTLLAAINLSDKEREEMGIRSLELARKYDLGEVSKILYTNYLALLKINRCIEIK